MKDDFFYVKNCQRCGAQLRGRIMSWFTDETICMDCSAKESEIKSKLPDRGRHHEGCGYVPSTEEGN